MYTICKKSSEHMKVGMSEAMDYNIKKLKTKPVKLMIFGKNAGKMCKIKHSSELGKFFQYNFISTNVFPYIFWMMKIHSKL